MAEDRAGKSHSGDDQQGQPRTGVGGARPHVFLVFLGGRKSNPWPGYSQSDSLPVYLRPIRYLKGRFAEK